MLKNTQSDSTYASVLADGRIHVSVPEGTEGAITREFETSSGEKGVKIELIYTELSGVISEVKFYEGDYGKQLLLTFVDGDEKPVTLALSTASNFGEDVLKKIINLDLALPVKFTPYAFTDDQTGKLKKGITITQDGKKIANYFYDAETKKNINGYPCPKKKKMTKDDWKIYFMEARIFLIEKVVEHFKLDVAKPTEGDIEF